MSLFSAARGAITRQTVTPDNGAVVHTESKKIAPIVSLLDGGGTNLVKAKVIERFCQEITKSPTTSIELTDSITNEGFEARRNEAQVAAVTNGLHTIVSTFLFNRIVEIRASLFGSGSIYTYDTDSFEADLADSRGIGLHDRRMGRLDLLATGVGSAGLLTQADALGYSYQPFDPTACWCVFGSVLDVDGARALAQHTNIEHASIVVLKLSTGSVDKSDFVAYFGRQDEYHQGRLVKYASKNWDDIPDPGGGGEDWTSADEWSQYPMTDELANPLTVQQDAAGGLYEYPIITWQCDSVADGTTLFPATGTALYDQVFELDVEMSRIIEAAGRSAAGTWILGNSKDTPILGPWNEGLVQTTRDQTVSLLSHAASNAKDALFLINQLAESTAARYHVPGYMVASSESFSVPTGIALKMLNLPLLWDRKKRAELNMASMARKFEIEKNLVNFVQGTTVIPQDATENWEPQPLEFPEDSVETIAWNEHLLAHNMASVEELIVEMGRADSVEAAMTMIEQNKARQPVAPEPPPAPVGILGRLRQGAQ